MEHTYTDYLFILAIYPDSINLDKLLFHIEPGGRATPEARRAAQQVLAEMEAKGYVHISGRDEACRVRLTAYGRMVSDKLAGLTADSMVSDWQAQRLEFTHTA